MIFIKKYKFYEIRFIFLLKLDSIQKKESDKKEENLNLDLMDGKDKECPECGGKLVTAENELVCDNCSLVVDESFIDRGPEWRAFSAEEEDEKSRTGTPSTVTRHDKGLSTEIGFKDRYGKDLPPEKKSQFYRLRRLHSQGKRITGKEKSLSVGLQEIHRMSSQLHLPKAIHEIAATIYKSASEKGLIKGRSIESMAAATLYLSSRFYDVPRTLDEVAEVSRVSRKEIARAERYISRELEISLKPTSPKDYVSRFVSKLDLSNECQKKSIEIIEEVNNGGAFSGKSPVSIAAAAIYIAAKILDEKITQKDLSEVSKISAVTIRKRYKDLIEEIDIEI